MARKSAFSPEDVVQAGFRLVDKLGREHLTARNVAKELGSSTAPVYSNFNNMEELEKALIEEALSRILATSKTGSSGDHFLNIGLGILGFAWQHPRWYEALFMVKNAQEIPGFTLMEELLEAMDKMLEFQDMAVYERTIVLKKMAIFTHGLATEIVISGTDDVSFEEWKILLEEVGDTIVKDAFQRTPRSPKEIELLGSLCKWSQPRNLEKEED